LEKDAQLRGVNPYFIEVSLYLFWTSFLFTLKGKAPLHYRYGADFIKRNRPVNDEGG